MTADALIINGTVVLGAVAFLLAYYAINLNEDWMPVKLIFLSGSLYFSILDINFVYQAMLSATEVWAENVVNMLLIAYRILLWFTYIFLLFTVLYGLYWVYKVIMAYRKAKAEAKYGAKID